METTDNQKPIRKIIHVGMDCFYAAVMTRNDPSLQGNPVVVVGCDPDKKEVICSANYEARKLGIHAGMESYRAKQLYSKLVILLSEMNTYNKESKKIRAIFHRFTNMVEPLSLDEAYLDVTGSDKFKGDAVLIASEIRKLIHEETQLTASAGIASNKLFAKVASGWKKPNGQFAIIPDMLDDFVLKLPVKKIWEIGKEAAEKMTGLGLITCGDLQKLSLNDLDSKFGSIGKQLYNICRGIDNRSVVAGKDAKSLSIEEMFPTDIQVVGENKEDEKQGDVKESSLETTTSIETDEDTQEMSKIYESVTNLFKNAAIFFIEFKDKKYQGTLAESEPGKQIVFTISKPDTYLSMNVSEGDQVVLRLITNKGVLGAFESELIKKKLPQLIVKFPIKEDEKFIRTSRRTLTKINARIVRSKPKKISDMGTIINISDTGCSFTTKAMLKREDEIELLILLLVKGVERNYRIHGTIRRERTIDDETTNYGIECFDEDKKILMGIKVFVESQKAEKPNKTVT